MQSGRGEEKETNGDKVRQKKKKRVGKRLKEQKGDEGIKRRRERGGRKRDD